jgi:hypothetical protein
MKYLGLILFFNADTIILNRNSDHLSLPLQVLFYSNQDFSLQIREFYGI